MFGTFGTRTPSFHLSSFADGASCAGWMTGAALDEAAAVLRAGCSVLLCCMWMR